MIHVERLKQKKMARPKKEVIVQLKHGQITQEKEESEPTEEEEYDEIPIVPTENNDTIKVSMNKIVFVDKTNDYRVNRDLVLAKLNKYTNMAVVEKKKLAVPSHEPSFKIPVVERDLYTIPTVESEDAYIDRPRKISKKIIISEEEEEEEKLQLVKEKEHEDEETKDKEEEKKVIEEESNDKEEEKKVIEEESKDKEEEKKVIEEESREEDKEKQGQKQGPKKEVRERKVKEKETQIIKEHEDEGYAKKGTQKIYEESKYETVSKITRIGRKLVSTRMPKKEKLIIRTSNYYMNNRKMYIQKMAELFRPYKKEIIESMETASCDQTSNPTVDFELLTHQKIVRDYLNLYTPYRGLLLYHGLGSGKTCTSIAIAEGMKSVKPVILLTPASLQKNFFNEIKKCGDHLYKKHQYWEFISIVGKPNYASILSEVLQLPMDYIQKKKGAWMVDVSNKEANFTSLDSAQQMEINDQLDLMIRAKYTPINYNGIRMSHLKEWSNDFTVNPFDNKTVIIEEAHNFVSRVVNKVNKPNTLSYKLYDYLMKATNAKIVLLTGTPIINYPNELGILFNILRGYIKQWTFQLNIKSSAPPNFKLNKDEIIKMFEKEKLNVYDYIEYSTNKLTITRNPYGFVNEYKTDAKKKGGSNSENTNIVGKIMTLFQGGTTKKNRVVIKPKSRTTRKRNNHMNMNTNVQINDDATDIEPDARMEYQNRIYIDPHEGGSSHKEDDYIGVSLDDTGNISDADFEKEVRRILGMNHIEIIPAGSRIDLLKALPDNSESFLNMFIDNDTIQVKNENVFKKRVLGLSSYFRSAQEKLLPRFIKTDNNDNIHIVPVKMSSYQFNIYERVRQKEAEDEKSRRSKSKQGKDNVKDLFNISSAYRIFSRAACNFAFPDPPGRPMPDKVKSKLGKTENDEDSEHDGEYAETILDDVFGKDAVENDEYASVEDIEEIEKTVVPGNSYEQRIVAAMKMLEDSIDKSPEEQYLSSEKLELYSPKFLQIINNIRDEENRGLHLVYSQFRTIEGIGILRLALKANGFAELRIRKVESTGSWELIEKEEDAGKPRFALHTGTETAEEKEIIRNIYNSNWEIVPSAITSRLRETSDNNFYGQVLKVLMITASSSEGINLKNTRFVHLVEPYWHRVRIEQAIGRARRICSHQDLPEEDRTVKAFLYITVFSEEQKTNKKNIEMMARDISRIDGHPITTDESLLDTSNIKYNINKVLLDSVKETAIDCSVYNGVINADEQLVCYGFGKVESNSFASYPEIEKDIGETIDVNVRKKKLNLKLTKPIDGVVYVFDPNTLDVYDKDSYDQALLGNGELLKIGVFVRSGKGYILKTT